MINCYTIPITKCAGAYREIGEKGGEARFKGMVLIYRRIAFKDAWLGR